MEKERKHGPGHVFDDDELDEAVIAADDTGMVESEHEIVQEELLGEEEEDGRK